MTGVDSIAERHLRTLCKMIDVGMNTTYPDAVKPILEDPCSSHIPKSYRQCSFSPHSAA